MSLPIKNPGSQQSILLDEVDFILDRRDKLYSKFDSTHDLRFLCEANRLTQEAKDRMFAILQMPCMSSYTDPEKIVEVKLPAANWINPKANTESECFSDPHCNDYYDPKPSNFVRVASIRRRQPKMKGILKNGGKIEKETLAANKMFIRSEYVIRLAESRNDRKKSGNIVDNLREMIGKIKL